MLTTENVPEIVKNVIILLTCISLSVVAGSGEHGVHFLQSILGSLRSELYHTLMRYRKLLPPPLGYRL